MLDLARKRCHVQAMAATKQNRYQRFIIWHSLWHVVGVTLIVTCCIYNNTMEESLKTATTTTTTAGEAALELWYINS
jgi:hypothetical protein